MNVLQLISSMGFFGAENVVIELASGLKTNGDSVTVGIFKNRHTRGAGTSELVEQAWAKGLKTVVFECGGRMDLKTVFSIRNFVRENGIDIIHSHGYKSNIYACLANRKVKKRLPPTRPHMGKFRKPATRSNKVRAELGIPTDAKVIGTVGRLSPEKGYGFFLKAAHEVSEKKKDCFFLFAGDGIQTHALEEQARSLGIKDRVIFAGKRSDIPEVLSAMDLFILSSLTEGQPMALLEAMAAGTPSVATSVGDAPKILKAGEAGLIVPPSDSQGLAEGILQLLDDPALAARLSMAAARTVEESYSSNRMAAEYRACYKG